MGCEKVKKGEKTKRIQVTNYYQKDLSSAVELINSSVTEKFKMHHDKGKLLASQKRCEED